MTPKTRIAQRTRAVESMGVFRYSAIIVIRRTFFLVSLSLFLAGCAHVPSPTPQPLSSSPEKKVESSATFQTPKKSAHYESNTPAHGAILPAPPVNIVVDFNFDLTGLSEIRVYSSGVKNPRTGTTSPIDIAASETTIDANKLGMRRAIDPQAPDDTYTVDYTACWPDKSCHDGMFQFAIDRSSTESFMNQRGQSTVEISMKSIAFAPKQLRISRGTTVEWTNDDTVDHYVNTDSHPAHTYEPMQNSKLLKPGDHYSYTFTKPGAYPYHCSAHADTMTGIIMVE